MQVQVSGKHVDVGEALGSRISQELNDGVGKYFERGGQDAEVVVSKDGHGFKVDCWVRLASGQSLVTTGTGGDVLSDDRIVDILKEAGVDIARRTVAKYREALRIPSSVERKRMLRRA